MEATSQGSRKEYMYGKAYYIKMIEPDLGEEYLRRLDAIRW